MAVPATSRRAQIAGVLMLGMAALAWADKVQEVGVDFLEYLGSLEGEDDNWTDFTAEAVAARQARSAASSSSASIVTSAAASSKSSSSAMSKAGK